MQVDADEVKTENNIVFFPIQPETSASVPVLPTFKKYVQFKACKMTSEFIQKFMNDLLVVNDLSELGELLAGKRQITFQHIVNVFNETAGVPKGLNPFSNPNDVVRLNKNQNRIRLKGRKGLYVSNPTTAEKNYSFNKISDISIDKYKINKKHEDNIENNKRGLNAVHDNGESNEIHLRMGKIVRKDEIIKPSIKKVKREKKRNKVNLDSVSDETKMDLNKYLDHGANSQKILKLIEMLNQSKRVYKSNDKPKININIFKMIKPGDTQSDEKDFAKQSEHSKLDNNQTSEGGVSSDSIEKRIELDNDKYNLALQVNSAETKDHNKTETTKKIQLLETNVNSESDSIENNKQSNAPKINETNKKQNEIKYLETDASEILSSEITNGLINKILDETTKSVETTTQKSKHYKSKHKKKKHKISKKNRGYDDDDSKGDQGKKATEKEEKKNEHGFDVGDFLGIKNKEEKNAKWEMDPDIKASISFEIKSDEDTNKKDKIEKSDPGSNVDDSIEINTKARNDVSYETPQKQDKNNLNYLKEPITSGIYNKGNKIKFRTGRRHNKNLRSINDRGDIDFQNH